MNSENKMWLVNCLYDKDFNIICFYDTRISANDILLYLHSDIKIHHSYITSSGERLKTNRSKLKFEALDLMNNKYNFSYTVIDYPVIDGYLVGKDKIKVFCLDYKTPFVCSFDFENYNWVRGRVSDLIRNTSMIDGLIDHDLQFITVERINDWKASK